MKKKVNTQGYNIFTSGSWFRNRSTALRKRVPRDATPGILTNNKKIKLYFSCLINIVINPLIYCFFILLAVNNLNPIKSLVI